MRSSLFVALASQPACQPASESSDFRCRIQPPYQPTNNSILLHLIPSFLRSDPSPFDNSSPPPQLALHRHTIMGGKAFSSGLRALFTPRLAREVYEHAQQQCFAALKPLFPLVKSPVEAPEKTTFGDIDVLACLEGSSFTADEIGDPKKAAVWEAVAKELRPARTFQESTLVKNFALPWPALTGEMMARQLAVEAAVGDEAVRCGDKAVASGGEAEKEAEQKPRYIQVDIHLCATNRELEWSYL